MSEYDAEFVRKHYERMGKPVPADVERQLAAAEKIPPPFANGTPPLLRAGREGRPAGPEESAAQAVIDEVKERAGKPLRPREAPAVRAARRKDREKMEATPDPKNPAIEFTLPLPPSVNHLYATAGKDRRRMMSEAGRAWKKNARQYAVVVTLRQGWNRTCHSKVVVEITAFWPDDSRARDMSNLHKALADALEGIVYLNDSKALLRDMNYHTAPEWPRVKLKIYQMEA